jgi:O-acetyl-ADP-ribose deacetylase (regulator of RNase III)
VITYVEGDLFDSPAQVLVNTVNTVGVMGKGIALRFKRAFPEMFQQYQMLCETKQLQVGHLWLYRGTERWVLNFPTKKHWRNPSRVEYLEAGLERFRDIYAEAGILSIAFPQLGCGNGELTWQDQVRPLMETYLSNLPIDVFVHLYPSDRVPEHRAPDEMRRWLRLEVESLAFAEVWDDLAALLRESSQFETLVERTSFQAMLDPAAQEHLCLRTPADTVVIPREALLGLWQQLRTYGYLLPGVLEADFEQYLPYIAAILAHLPYIRPVRVASDPNRLSRPDSLGLQWAPRTKSKPEHPDAQVIQPLLV